jgi:micrococcal nuclease
MNARLLKSNWIYFTLGILMGLVIILFYKPATTKNESTKIGVPQPDFSFYVVEKVIDGDTLRLEDGRQVRLLGVDTPESKHAQVPVQVFSQEAYEFSKQMTEGFEVRLEYDAEATDKYGRVLAYVYLRDGRMLNEELLKRGYAYVLRRFPFKKKREFLYIQDIARQEQRGLWSYNLTSGRLTLIAEKFDQLSEEGKREFDIELDKLIEKYPKQEE